eukprot:GHVU01067488.1.p1 GENE.GHVU01067488.1~~GHVU01067488.1.p1  ORF type:complete len:206 (-),score=11.69 GHVU01067488.1:1400-2017(-)
MSTCTCANRCVCVCLLARDSGWRYTWLSWYDPLASFMRYERLETKSSTGEEILKAFHKAHKGDKRIEKMTLYCRHWSSGIRELSTLRKCPLGIQAVALDPETGTTRFHVLSPSPLRPQFACLPGPACFFILVLLLLLLLFLLLLLLLLLLLHRLISLIIPPPPYVISSSSCVPVAAPSRIPPLATVVAETLIFLQPLDCLIVLLV